MEYQRFTERFEQFSLRANDWCLLPLRQSLVVDRVTGVLTVVDWQSERFTSICDDLDDEQFSLVITLLRRWPSYVSYEQLLEQLGIQLSAQDLADLERVRESKQTRTSRRESRATERARARLQPVLQTLRDLLSGSRACLNFLGIDIAAVLDYGPLLVQYVEARAPQAEQSAG